jgi:hypothetical protein
MTVAPVLRPLAGLAIWAAHFIIVYALTAIACERGWVTRSVAGLPWVPAMVGIATLVALALLAWAFRPALLPPRTVLIEGGESEPRFTRWFAGSCAALSTLAVLFQALPAVMLPGCG